LGAALRIVFSYCGASIFGLIPKGEFILSLSKEALPVEGFSKAQPASVVIYLAVFLTAF